MTGCRGRLWWRSSGGDNCDFWSLIITLLKLDLSTFFFFLNNLSASTNGYENRTNAFQEQTFQFTAKKSTFKKCIQIPWSLEYCLESNFSSFQEIIIPDTWVFHVQSKQSNPSHEPTPENLQLGSIQTKQSTFWKWIWQIWASKCLCCFVAQGNLFLYCIYDNKSFESWILTSVTEQSWRHTG